MCAGQPETFALGPFEVLVLDAAPMAEPTPKSVDLRPVFQKWGLKTRSQGKRGTCSAFVVTEAMEHAVASKQGRPTRLSVEFLNWASNRVTKQPEDGGFFSDLWKGYAEYGVCPEEDGWQGLDPRR